MYFSVVFKSANKANQHRTLRLARALLAILSIPSHAHSLH
jgi:hypothetical protein